MAVILLWFGCTIAAGDVIYVDADASTGGDGTTWGTAYKYLQDALDDAVADDEIWVAEGTYRPDENTANPGRTGSRTAMFQLQIRVVIYGGYAGYGAPVPNERDIELYETILSGDLLGNDGANFVNNDDNSYHVVTGSGTEPNAILDGFTITAGNANGSAPHHVGGGMNNYQGSPTVANCTFSTNEAGKGGGMHNYYSSPTVTNCTFTGNLVGERGGGMYNEYYSSPTVTNCTFSGNSAGEYGGGMLNYGYAGTCSPTLTNCTFSGNSAGNDGGGMRNNSSNPTVTNCTFSRNSAPNGSGGGIYNYNNSYPTVSNCILWGDSAPTGPEIYNSSSTPTVTYSDIAGGYGGTGNIPDDPCFVDPNGLDGIIGTEDDNLRLSASSPCIDAGTNVAVPSDTVDLDGDGDTSEWTPLDLDGNARFTDDPAVTDTGHPGFPALPIPIVDMGAYERYGFCSDAEHPYPEGDVNHDCAVDFYDIAIVAEQWLECTKPECD